MAMRAPRIKRINGGTKEIVSVFLVEHGGVLSIIDAGTEGCAKRVLRALGEVGRKREDVRQIVLTHAHGDHSGDGRRLREDTGATVVAGAEDAPVIEGSAPYPMPRTGLLRAIYGRLSRYPRLTVDRPVKGREELDGGLVVIPAPGHTAGHIAVLAPDLSALFMGDAVWHLGPLTTPLNGFIQDPERNRESVRELAALGVRRVIPAHGPPTTGERLRALAARL